MKYIYTITLALFLSVTSNISTVYADDIERLHKKCDRQAQGLVTNFRKTNKSLKKDGYPPMHSEVSLRETYLEWYWHCMGVPDPNKK